MYKTDVVRAVARQTRYSQKAISEIIDAVHGVIKESLRKGEQVVFLEFGSFQTSQRKAGKVKSIKTRELIEYPARMVATFRPGEKLKKAVRTVKTVGKPKRGKRSKAS
jgi:DNA-binding protein HU-beta